MQWLPFTVRVVALSILAQAQYDPRAPLPDWVMRMSRVKHHLKDNFAHIPDYVCEETVDRYRDMPGRAHVKIDSLKFDVAEVNGREFFARTGHGFEFSDLSPFISQGIIATGQFSTMTGNLFVADGAIVKPHAVMAFVPSGPGEGWDFEFSEYQNVTQIVRAGVRVTVGVRGTFWIDTQSMDLLRVDEEVVNMPPITRMRASTSTVDYARMQIGNSNVLLPQSALLTVTELNGTEQRNQVKFSGCREYSSQSSVRFGDIAEPPPPPTKK